MVGALDETVKDFIVHLLQATNTALDLGAPAIPQSVQVFIETRALDPSTDTFASLKVPQLPRQYLVMLGFEDWSYTRGLCSSFAQHNKENLTEVPKEAMTNLQIKETQFSSQSSKPITPTSKDPIAALCAELSDRLDGLQLSNTKLEAANKQLMSSNAELMQKLAKERDNRKAEQKWLEVRLEARLEAEQKRLEAEQKRLEARLGVQEKQLAKQASELEEYKGLLVKERNERRDDIQTITQLTLKLMPLHLRVLLDLGREQVLNIMQIDSWEDLRNDRSFHQLTDTIMQALANTDSQYRPSQDAIEFLCSYNNVRKDGNYHAHVASQDEIRETVLAKPIDSQQHLLLTQLYQFIFHCTV